MKMKSVQKFNLEKKTKNKTKQNRNLKKTYSSTCAVSLKYFDSPTKKTIKH